MVRRSHASVLSGSTSSSASTVAMPLHQQLSSQHHERQCHRRAPPNHGRKPTKRKRPPSSTPSTRPARPTSTSNSNTALCTTLLTYYLTTTSTTTTTTHAIPMSNSILGGYLTYPKSRNYLAWSSNALLPSKSHPLESLAEFEPTPHSLTGGTTCGNADGTERDYDEPMSRINGQTMPLNIQAIYPYDENGIEITVKVSLFGIDGGGHFEFHACPLTYPEKPTPECFQKYPLQFVSDEYYGAVPDPLYPERAYVPTLNSASSNEFSGGWTPVEDAHVGPGGGQMMEFSYRVLFPKDSSELWTENYEIVDGDLIVGNAVEAQNEAFANTDNNVDNNSGGGGEGGLRRRRQRKLGEINHDKRNVNIGDVVFGEEASQNEDTSAAAAAQETQATQETQDDQADAKSEEFAEEAPPVTQTINWAAHGVSGPDVNWAFNGAAPSGTDWAGDPNKDANNDAGSDGNTDTNDAGDTTNNNDGGGQLGIDWASNGVTVPEGTPDVFWAQNSIGVDWASKNPVPEGVADIFWHENEVKANATAAQNNGTQSGPVPVLGDVASSSKKYILLQWHYVTARDCYQPGYDTYSWPASWGAWRPPWGGVCDGDEGQTQYYNCAEVMILGPGAYSPPSQAPTGVPELEKLTTSVSPKAVSDLVLVGVSDMAYMNVLQNDVDPDGDDLVIGEVTQPEHGKIEIMEDGIVLVYRPDPDFTGVDSFEYTACDPGNLCDSAKVDVIVGPVIDAVFARDDRVTVVGSEPVEVNVTKNDAVRVNYPLTVTKTRGSRNGTCVITSDTQITYTANEGFQGRDRCEYTVCATEICDEARLEIQVLAPVVEMSSSGPIANADAVTIEVNEVAHIDPLRNDDDADGDVLIVTSVSVPDNGDVVIVNGGLSLEYMPDEGFTGVDTFTYTVCDTTDLCDSADVNVIIKPDFKTVIANDDGVLTGYELPIKIDVISNDEVVGSVEPIVSKVSDSFNGKCEITSDNQVKFTPKRSFEGWGRCSYTVCVDDVCDEARIKIKVFPETLIDRPAPIPATATVEVTAKADKVSTGAGEPISIDVTKNDSTTSTQPLTVTEGSIASNGNCEVTDDNQIMYTPDAGFSGQDRCSYEVCVDNVCDIGQIGIKVFPDHPETNSPTKKPTMMPIEVLSAPVEVFAMDDQAATATETIVIDVTANDISTGDLPLTVTDAQDARHGQCEVTESNKVRYIPDGDFAGWDKCKYMVCLGDVCDKGLIEIKVLSTPIYDVYEMPKPAVETMDLVTAEVEIEKVYADDDDVETSVNQPIEVDVTHNDFVRGMDPLIVKFTGNAANGECEIIDGIQVKYTPSRDFVGQDQCDYTVCLQNLQTNCDKGVITINVASSKPMKQTSSEIIDEDIRSNNGSVSPSAAKNCIHSKSRSNLGGRKLRGRKLGANSGTFQSCVGTSLVTAITTNNKEDTTTETVTYTSTYHLKRARSAVPQSSFSDLSILRMGSTASMNAVENAYTETVISLPVNADATIMPGFPDQNFGTTSTLLINSVSSSGGRFDSVLRFQTSSVVASVCDGGILNAKLFLYSLAASTHGGTFATTSKKSWTETNVTWNSSPKGDGIVLARLGAVEKNKWYEVDVSAAINIGEPLGIRITSDDETSSRAQYASKNHSSEALSPVLKITCLNFDGVTEGNE